MRVRRVHVPGLRAGTVRLLGAEAHHLARVLRIRPSDAVVGFDGDGAEADGRVEEVAGDEVTIRFEPLRAARSEAPLEIHVAVALLKGDKLGQVVRQATELGATRIRPFVSSRCDVPTLSPSKAARIGRIAEEAAKQSGRARVPEIDPVERFDRLAWTGPAWIADPTAARSWVTLDVEAALEAGCVTFLSGPEGGFTSSEVASAEERGAIAVRMGARVLRAETAPIALLAGLLAKIEA